MIITIRVLVKKKLIEQSFEKNKAQYLNRVIPTPDYVVYSIYNHIIRLLPNFSYAKGIKNKKTLGNSRQDFTIKMPRRGLGYFME